MFIGITERGDAGLDLSWKDRLNNVSGAIVITKCINEHFVEAVLNASKPLIVHCTCTGWGGTKLEPNVPSYTKQLDNLKSLIDKGFPADRCVLRVDPIFPNANGVKRVDEVLNYFKALNTGVNRIRVSILDEYSHVKKRFINNGWTPIYLGNNKFPSYGQVQIVADCLNQHTDLLYETCAEDTLSELLYNARPLGCVSNLDLLLMGIDEEVHGTNPQNRDGCHCLSCKRELLCNKAQCYHGCVYCYWR